mgnify:FL=1
MKKLLPILFLLPSAAMADMTSTITSSVQIDVQSAATAVERMANSYSVSGSGVETTDGTTAGLIGGLGDVTDGVNAFTTITASQLTDGETFQFQQSYLAGDSLESSAVTTGEVANFSNITSTAAGVLSDGAATIDNHVIEVTGGGAGTSITGQYVTTLSVD